MKLKGLIIRRVVMKISILVLAFFVRREKKQGHQQLNSQSKEKCRKLGFRKEDRSSSMKSEEGIMNNHTF